MINCARRGGHDIPSAVQSPANRRVHHLSIVSSADLSPAASATASHRSSAHLIRGWSFPGRSSAGAWSSNIASCPRARAGGDTPRGGDGIWREVAISTTPGRCDHRVGRGGKRPQQFRPLHCRPYADAVATPRFGAAVATASCAAVPDHRTPVRGHDVGMSQRHGHSIRKDRVSLRSGCASWLPLLRRGWS